MASILTASAQDVESVKEIKALQSVITALRDVSADGQRRILDSAATFLSIAPLGATREYGRTVLSAPAMRPAQSPFSDDSMMSPKDFLLEKQPRSDVERVACLAYYLTHYRDTPHFKTLDLSKLNTEAAQPKFSNAANATNNAVKRGYLVPSVRGQRQLSASGERFVRALPDRDAARQAMETVRTRRRSKRSRSANTGSAD